MTTIQVFCTLAELDEDLNLRGSEREAKVYDKLLAASKLLMNRIGWFLPVTMAHKYHGHGQTRLFTKPILSITSIVNDDDTLATTDYILQPDGRHWENGPYSWIDADPDATNLSTWMDEEEGVVINGPVGLYNYSEALGITLGAEMSAAAATMQVSDGSKASPGLVALIGTEQILVTSTSATPTATATTLNGALSASADVATLADGTKVSIGEIVRIGVEQCKVLDINGNTVYLQRGWNKTKAVAHDTGSNVEVYRTFNVLRGVNGTTAAIHASASAISRQMVPEDINFLARKIAGRMLKDAQSGFTGRIGDETTGQAIYTYILPHELDAVASAYRIPRA